MGFARLDDGFWHNEKLEKVSDRAHRLYVRGISLASAMATDGIISRQKLRILDQKPSVADELVQAGLWEIHEEGWIIHDYVAHNTSSEERQNKARNAANVRWSKPKEDARSNAPSNATSIASGTSNEHMLKHAYTEQYRAVQSSTEQSIEHGFATDEFMDPVLAKVTTRLEELGIPLGDRIGEMVKSRLDDGCKPEWIIMAAEKAATKAAGWNYVASILDRWKRDGGPPEAQRNTPTPLPVRRSVSFSDPDYVGNTKRSWPTEEEMRASEARQ